MPRKAANKTKAWRKDVEIHMMPQEVETTNEAGEVVKQTVAAPYALKGRMLRDYRRMSGVNVKPMASNLMINLLTRGGFVTIEKKGDETPVVAV